MQPKNYEENKVDVSWSFKKHQHGHAKMTTTSFLHAVDRLYAYQMTKLATEREIALAKYNFESMQ